MSDRRSSAGRPDPLLQELKDLLTQLGIRVREEKLLREVGYRVYGGGCRLRGEEMVFLDRERPSSERIEVLLEEVAEKNLDGLPLSAKLRRVLTREDAP
jgi:hypothetical protein